MRITLDEASARYAVTTFECTERFQRVIGVSTKSMGQPLSVYLTRSPPTLKAGEIEVDPDQLVALSVGEAGLGLLIWEGVAVASASSAPRQVGDESFLRSADIELGSEGRRLAEAMIGEVRVLQPGGDLREGQHRKFINYPDNFVGFTVQTRNRAILVHVRESAVSKAAKTVRVAADRRPYVRFWVQSEGQLAEALQIIRASWSRG